MKTWPAPTVPTIEPSGVLPTFHSTLTGRREQFAPRVEGVATLYVCGITPYDSTHMGHAMTYHSADLMRRILLDAGLDVRFAENVTDVDDPLFERAQRDDIDWRELADREVAKFVGDMEALRIIPPHHFESVSEAVDAIADAANQLLERGMLYPVANEDGSSDWYQEYALTGGTGLVEQMDREEALAIFAERGGDPQREGKKDPLDPLVWQAHRPGEPSFDGRALGPGRPGWHVECLCIAERGLGMPIDLEIGGSDLVFPHHEMGHVHALGLGLDTFATLWAHVGMVAYQGEKMSKSLGNLVFISRLNADGVDPAAIRLALLAHHYRTDWEWSDDQLREAEQRLRAYREASQQRPTDAAVVEDLRRALRDDLDTPRALEVLDRWADGMGGSAAATPGAGGIRIADAVDALLGVRL